MLREAIETGKFDLSCELQIRAAFETDKGEKRKETEVEKDAICS